jgi:SAM-dependent methyltransferase
MVRSLETVRRLNADARARGVADAILQFDNVTTQAQYRLAYEMADRYVTPGARVLDWGCGNGHFSFYLESLGASITGYSYEPRPSSMRNAREFEFVAGNPDSPSALPFDDAAFDISVGVGVLEHVWETGGNERASLAELARVTRPGGILLTFHLPNRHGWIEPLSHRVQPNAHYHRRKFDAAEIRALWDEAGFDVLELKLYNALPRNQIRGLPAAVRHSRLFATAYDAVDGAIERLVPRLCTNFGVVGRRR